MNKERRKQLGSVTEKLNSCSNELESIKDDEDDARNNIPEGLQSGEAYNISEEYSDTLSDAITDIQGVIEKIETIIQ